MSSSCPSAGNSNPDPFVQAWANYWIGNNLGSIDLDATDDPVAFALREHWAQQLPWLALQDVVVDVGSGPAILPTHLHRTSGQKLQGTRWICVERANLAPGQVSLPQVQMLEGVDLCTHPAPEPLPWALVSNFGLEYVNRDLAAMACRRWLRPGGRLHCVMHARGSPIDSASEGAIADIDHALGPSGLLAQLKALLIAASTVPHEATLRAQHGRTQREAYNQAVHELKQIMQARGQASPVWLDMFKLASALVPQALGGHASAALKALEQHGQAYANEARRARAMRASAMEQQQLNAFKVQLRQAGFEHVTAAPLTSSLGSVAWVVQAVAST